jgi:gas vesicle protein
MRMFRIAAGALLGAAVGMAVVLLFAPQRGAATRQMLADRIQLVLEEGRQAAEARRRELQAQFEALKQPESRS